MNVKNLLAKRRVKFGVASTAFTALFLAVIVAVNLLTSLLVEKFPIKLDLTPEKIYDISQDTKDYLSSVGEEVTITILTPEAKFNSLILEMLKNYTKYNSNIKFEAIDLNANPKYAQKFGTTESVTTTSIVIESGRRYKVLSLYDLYQYNSDQTQVVGLKAEQKLTSAVMYVTDQQLPVMYLTSGHGEGAPTQFSSICEDNNYQVEEKSLMVDEIAEDVSLVVIYNPVKDFSDEEIEKLDKYIDRAGTNLLVFLSPEAPALPKLQAYLTEWGIGVNDDMVFEEKMYYSYPYYLVPQYGDSDILEDISAKSIAVMPVARSLNVLFEARNSFTTFTLLSSYDTAYSKAGTADDFSKMTDLTKQSGDATGPFVLAAGSEKMFSKDNTVKYSRLLVFGSAGFADDSVLQVSSFANTDILAQSVGWMRGNADMITISPTYFEDSAMTNTGAETVAMGVLFIIVIPLLLIAMGIFVWVRRKNL